MVEKDPFPTLPKTGITKNEILQFLISLRNTNLMEIYRDQDHDGVYFIIINENYRIRISHVILSGHTQVQLQNFENLVDFRDVLTLPQLESAFSLLAKKVVPTWPQRQTSGRLYAEKPASNLITISSLIGASSIDAVFDPYIDNRSFATILNILSFGEGSVSNDIRIIGSDATIGSPFPRLTKVGVDSWFAEHKISGEVRIVAKKSEHRRFMLLSGGQSLILGPSLNAIHKNEAVRLEIDAEDRPFFNSTWATAVPLT